MNGLERLGRIIDDLFKQKQHHQPLNKGLIFLVGDGIDPVNNILNDKKLREKAGNKYKTRKSFEAYKWRHFEYARYYTSTTLPTFAHCCIFKFVETGLCRNVITTNYDMFFDSIWQHYPQMRVVQNPVNEQDEYSWEGYYSGRDSSKKRPRYWKIHGSLSHVCFGKSNCQLYKLPRFAISTNDNQLAQRFGIPSQAPFMGFEKACYPRTPFAAQEDLKGRFFPFIDWTYGNDRARFNREINAAKNVLNSKYNAAIILLGFSGYYNDSNDSDPRNEELVPTIRKLRAKGFNDVYMAVKQSQAEKIREPQFGLMRELLEADRCWPYTIAGAFMSDLISKYCSKFPDKYTSSDYKRWRLWCQPPGEHNHDE